MSNPTGPSILEQLNQGWRAKAWTVEELAEKLAATSEFKFERTTMGKKMKGQIPLKGTEIEALATLFDITIVWPAPPISEPEETSPIEGAA